MTFASQLSSDLSAFLNTSEFAETVSYNSTSISAIFDTEGQRPADYFGDFAVLYVSASDVASPSYRDTVVIGGETWKVFDDQSKARPELSPDRRMWAIPLYKAEKPKVWG